VIPAITLPRGSSFLEGHTVVGDEFHEFAVGWATNQNGFSLGISAVNSGALQDLRSQRRGIGTERSPAGGKWGGTPERVRSTSTWGVLTLIVRHWAVGILGTTPEEIQRRGMRWSRHAPSPTSRVSRRH